MTDQRSAHVRVEPKGPDFDAEVGEQIMDAAIRNGYRWPTVCHGNGDCTACHVQVLAGIENLSDMTHFEKQAMASILFRHKDSVPGEWRLACQAQVRGDVTVFKRSVRPQPQ